MSIRYKQMALVVVVLMAVAVVWAATSYAAAKPAKADTSKLWLSHFLGNQVIVTFITAPPKGRRVVKARLMDAEVPGVVLGFGKEEIFFPYSNIISIEPASEGDNK